MTILYEGADRLHAVCAARILDTNTELAWAENFVVENPHYKYIMGRYVEADRPNSNNQFFTLANLEFGKPTLTYAPLDINHDPPFVGTFVASEIVYPTESAGEGANPYLEALAAFWKDFYEDTYKVIEAAYNAGSLYFSMAAAPEKVTCGGANGCGETFEYVGRAHMSYCSHLNDRASGVVRDFTRPHFTGGALIVPPVKPGWSNADIQQISRIEAQDQEWLENLYQDIAEESPAADPDEWEAVMQQILLMAEANGEAAEWRKKKKSKKAVM